MLCNVAVRRTRIDDQDTFALRITGKTAAGPAGTGGQDIKEYTTVEDLLATLEQLGVIHEVIAAATHVLGSEKRSARFTDVAVDIQVPFESLERADIYLFDSSY